MVRETAIGSDSVSATLAPQTVGTLQSNSAGPQITSTGRQDQQSAVREQLCRKERERGSSTVLERNVEIPPTIAMSPPTDSGRGKFKSLGNWVKPPVRSLLMGKPLEDNSAQEQGAMENITNAAMATTAFAPTLRTPGFSPSSLGRYDWLSWAPTSPTLLPSRACHARPFSRLVVEHSQRIQHNCI